MKILTLNTHSLIEPEYEEKLRGFVETALQEQPDIIGLQEVNQTASAPVWNQGHMEQYVACMEGVEIREDNHAAHVAAMLAEGGQRYYWTWLPIKLGYDRYDEGLALFSRTPILETRQFFISRGQDYKNWKTRKILGIRTEAGWFYTVHMGWWDDEEEPFAQQWERVMDGLGTSSERVWLMGDFNSPADVRGQGYDCVAASGWKDTYLLAQTRDSGVTVEKAIDGWREKEDWKDRGDGEQDICGMRIDCIWSLQDETVGSSAVIFNGRRGPVVSDHYGVMIEAG